MAKSLHMHAQVVQQVRQVPLLLLELRIARLSSFLCCSCTCTVGLAARRKRMRAVSTLIIVALLFHQTACVEPRPRPTAASDSPSPVKTQPTREATPEEGELYAEREQQATGLEKFTGGNHSLVTVLVVVLLVILILYLLKIIR
jgi:hypothetical protein